MGKKYYKEKKNRDKKFPKFKIVINYCNIENWGNVGGWILWKY